MNWDDFKGLKYYIAYAAVVIGFFVYSGATGWKWFNPTHTETEHNSGTGHHVGRSYIYHK
ncbi:hypothetical protein SAMN04488109_6412 [Chryseolinea serpens]|uniref:Uncharacterized protein n=1 Tax=Chryseolinea serpens TaxID=947013 RepID=A0A1M5XDJ8_9BACT|nr:hypothetical protein [Chryseolinea serpens]SHH97722.1 hypothetical protein SAMN04488109_6412 [Chryseolinea serpens]